MRDPVGNTSLPKLQEQHPVDDTRLPKLQEKPRYDYIHVTGNNEVLLLLPVTSGATVNLDHLCHAARKFREFMGSGFEGSSISALESLQRFEYAILRQI